MVKLGFKFEPRKKIYYVDTHENPENIAYRKKFITRYFEYELRSHCWYQISKDEKMEYVKKGELDVGSGYEYKDGEKEMYEYHVDDHPSFQENCNHLPFGGMLSVRKPANLKPIMILGQDECIFRQFVFSKGMWTTPDGQKQLLPKDQGQGIMLSSFCCRELGYGFTPTSECFAAVNSIRAGKEYSDAEAAEKINGTRKKTNLTTSPFVRKLEYRANNDGYWQYEHMITQLEDCVDILRYSFPAFDFVFLFDHSSGHDRMQPNGLSLSKINVRHGGKQPFMRSSIITHDLLGPYHSSQSPLQPGMTQCMVFDDSHEGPCYLSDQKRQQCRYDQTTNITKERDLIVAELIHHLKTNGMHNPVGNKDKLKKCVREKDYQQNVLIQR